MGKKYAQLIAVFATGALIEKKVDIEDTKEIAAFVESNGRGGGLVSIAIFDEETKTSAPEGFVPVASFEALENTVNSMSARLEQVAALALEAKNDAVAAMDIAAQSSNTVSGS